MNRFQMMCTSATRPLHIRYRLQQRGKGQLVKAKLRSTFCTLSLKTFRSRSRRSGSRKSAIRVTNGTFENLKPTMADDIRIVAHSKYDSYPTGYSEEDASNARLLCPHGTTNTFSITRITMRLQVRRWHPKANTITTSITSKGDPTERFIAMG